MGPREWQARGVGRSDTGESPAADDPVIDVRSDAGANGSTDEELLAVYAAALADGVDEALPGWVAASVVRRLGGDVPDDLEQRVIDAGRAAAEEVGGRVRELLMLDIDEQWTNPLTLIRTAIRYPTEVLRSIDAPIVERDEQSRRFHPDDVYDLTPASFADLGPAIHDLGLSWGAAKAHVHLRRRRREEVA